MSPLPPFVLTQEQAKRLLAYIQTYRRHMLTQILPSTQRNTHQRVLQALQGKLLQESEHGQHVPLFLIGEEIAALKMMISDLSALTAHELETRQRDATLADLSALKAVLESLFCPAPRRQHTQTLF